MMSRELLRTSFVGCVVLLVANSTVFAQDAAQQAYKSGALEKSLQQQQFNWLVKHPTIVKLVELANEERARNGLPKVTIDPEMCKAAQDHAIWMAKTGFYGHSSLPWQEIIFQGPRTPEEAIQGWIFSPAHHGIMLSGSQVGFGYMVLSGRTYWVGVFR